MLLTFFSKKKKKKNTPYLVSLERELFSQFVKLTSYD